MRGWFSLRVASGVLLSASSLVGCTGMHTQFGCNAVAGTSCMPVEEVNAKAERGEFTRRVPERTRSAAWAPPSRARWGRPGGSPGRVADWVQRVWIAPYEDGRHTYHESRYVDAVLRPSHWRGGA